MRWAHVAIIGLIAATLAGCGDHADPMARLRAQVRKNPDSVQARIALGDAYFENESYHDAFVQYSAAKELDSNSFEATLGLARANEALNDLDGAAERIKQALEIKPGDPNALALRGKLLLRTDRAERAAEVLSAALKADPENEEAHRYLPVAYLRSDQLPKAEEAAREAVKRLPDSVEAQMNLATALLAREKMDDAEQVLRKAIELAPSDPIPPLRLAELLVREGRKLEEAVELSDRSTELDPGQGEAEAVAALALRRQGRVEEAVRRLHGAAIAHPRNVRLWLMLASLYRELGDEEAAARAAGMAFRFAPRRRVRAREDEAADAVGGPAGRPPAADAAGGAEAPDGPGT